MFTIYMNVCMYLAMYRQIARCSLAVTLKIIDAERLVYVYDLIWRQGCQT